MSQLSAYAVSATGFESQETGRRHKTIVNARSAGKAKYEHYLDIHDCFPDLPFTAMRARRVGPVHTSEEFANCARKRGLPNVRCGQRVRVGSQTGVIVGHNSSSNFDVLFDEGTEWAGRTLNVHPGGCVLLEG